MKLETAKLIEKAAEVLGVKVKIYEDYSGRGMFGRTTTAIVGDQSDITRATMWAAYELGRDSLEDSDPIDAFMDDTNFKWDNMGRSDMVAY